MNRAFPRLRRWTLTFAATTAAIFALSATSWAASLLTEEFDYTAGTLLTANGWTAHSGAGTNAYTVTAPSLSYAGYASSGIGNAVALGASGEDANRTFTTQSGGTVYTAALMNVTSSSTTGDYFFHLGVSPVVSTFSTRLFAKKDPALTTYAFGVNHASTAGTVVYTPFSYTPGTTYLVVMKQTFVAGASNDIIDLFVNPVPGAPEPAPTLTFTNTAQADPASVGAVCFRQGTTTPAVRIDGIRVATTWAEAVAAPAINHTITATAGAGGSITPSGAVVVADGASQSFTITPNSCFAIADVLVDGVSQGPVSSYTFTNVTADHTISASFTALGPYTVTASADAGGTISPSGPQSVACGASQSFTITPDACYSITNVLVDGVSVGAVGSYTFTNVQANHTIAASFAPSTYTITASAGTGGTISPAGASTVNCGDNPVYTFVADACYSIADVLVDGVSVGAMSSYTFTNVQANHTIHVAFSLNTYTITASAGAGGTITPSGAVSVNCGADQSFAIAADACYSIADVLVDGVSVGAVASHTFTNVQGNHSISATFSLNTYTITASAGPGGTISPSGAVAVNCGAGESFTITPDAGSAIADVVVDGVSQGAVGSYTFTNVQANHTITASFASTSHTITASAGAGGTISPSGAVSVADGGSQSFAITADPCFAIADVLVDGVSVGAVANYTFTNVIADHTISASFSAASYTITASAGGGGTISPDGAVSVVCGADQSLAIAADACHTIANVLVDGVSVGAVASYTFTNVQANHTIAASFALKIHTITASAGTGGTISPSGAVGVPCGTDQSFSIAASSCYAIADVLVDGVSVGAVSSYTFTNVQAGHTIAASFTLASYTLTIVTSGNGTVSASPPGPSYPCGTAVTLTATADPGWHFDHWGGDFAGSTNPLTFTMGANHTVTATFLLNVYTWNQTGTAAFATAGNWTPARFTPATDDVLEFTNGATTTATGVPTQTIGRLVVGGGTNVGLQSAAAATLSIAGGAGTDLDVASGATLQLNGTSAVTVALGSAATGTVGGTVNVIRAAHRITAVGGNSLVFQGGSLVTVGSTVTGSTGYSGNLFGTTALNTVVFQSGAIYAQSEGSNPFGANQPASVVTFQAGSRFRLMGPITPSFSGRTYADYENNTPGTTTTTGSATLTMDNFIVTSGTMNCNMTGTFNLRGNVTVNSGATLNFNPATPASVSFNGTTSTQTITANGTLTVFPNETFDVINTNGIALGSNLTIGGTLKFSGGKLTTGANTLIIPAAATVTGASQANGWVVGNLRKTMVGASASRQFEVGDASYYSPALVAMTGNAATFDLTGTAAVPDHPSLSSSAIDPSKSVNRYWTLTPAGSATFTSLSATFSFNAADLDGGTNPANFTVERFAGGTWFTTTPGTRTATSTQATGITAFGDFAVGEKLPHTIVASAGANGSISPSGSVVVQDGGNQTFTITPDACYAIADVKVDGGSVGAVASYTFTNVTADHTIEASFALSNYTITASSNAGGTITPNGAVSVVCGADQSFTIAADPCYHIADVAVDGVSVGAVGTYTFHNVQANHTIAATFSINVFTIAAAAGSGGSISPSGSIPVNCGADQTFTIAPSACHSVADVAVDGVSVGAVGSYTFTNVQANHTIAASFSLNVYTITASAGGGGTISPSGTVSVNCGQSQAFTIAAEACYLIADVVVDGASVGAVEDFTFTNVQANHTIAATFTLETKTLSVLVTGSGVVTKSPDQPAYDCGSNVTLTATPDPGWGFSGWSGDATGTDNPLVVVMDRNKTIRATFIDLSLPQVQVLAPNGGEVLNIGSVSTLRWTAADVAGVASVDLYISRNNGNDPFELIAFEEPNDGVYNWTVTGPGAPYAVFKVVAKNVIGNHAQDLSDASFIIQSAVTGVGGFVPEFALGRIMPNPMVEGTRIDYSVAREARVRITVADLQGRTVATLVDDVRPAGRHQAAWNGNSDHGALGAGVYFVRYQAGGKTFMRRLVLAR